MVFNKRLRFGLLIKRYKRFLADILCEDGSLLTAYCPNTGSMRSCSAPGSRVCLSWSENSTRKYPYTLEMIEVGQTWVGVNTSRSNDIVAEALERGRVEELEGFTSFNREVVVEKGTRLDFLAWRGDEKIYIEVKNCTLVENGVAMFPDAVTKRGTKHLLALERCVEKGDRGAVFFLVQRSDCSSFAPAVHIDAEYSNVLRRVYDRGVAIFVYQARVTPESIEVERRLPFTLSGR